MLCSWVLPRFTSEIMNQNCQRMVYLITYRRADESLLQTTSIIVSKESHKMNSSTNGNDFHNHMAIKPDKKCQWLAVRMWILVTNIQTTIRRTNMQLKNTEIYRHHQEWWLSLRNDVKKGKNRKEHLNVKEKRGWAFDRKWLYSALEYFQRTLLMQPTTEEPFTLHLN